MDATITKSERESLEELFATIQERRNFLLRLQNSRKEMLRIFKILFTKQKLFKQH